ncbi:10748_t:CDS:2 [Ambispora gerdemannii]|uniref:10748_t:CDS:1 n=1 Tax=Ambispora gerdemannii TaxID=144530 RepID=A0A9N9C3Z3_9GLOM|nr:10748_t:CDS:2 [Ambispora gerdemannii]
MKSLAISKSALIVLLVMTLSSVVFAFQFIKRQNNNCNGLRITSPTQPGLQWTNGQCYQVSFDAGANARGQIKVTCVDLYDARGNVVQTQWFGELDPTETSSTPNFNLNLGLSPKSGEYYLLVTAGGACTLSSVRFYATYNPNSGTTQCGN